jgi:hypothetical protein
MLKYFSGIDIMTEEQSTKTIRFTEENLEIPLVDILTGRGFITGKSGSGKSNTAGKIDEEILEAGYPLMVIDTEGEYYGLKEEYELLHVGADEECDLQVGAEHAEKIAELALEENVPIILDVSGYIDSREVNRLVHDTCKAMFDKEKKLKKPFPVFVEEAHEWIPQDGKRGEEVDVTGMLLRISARGRKRGLGICALSQRPAKVDKDHVTQADYKIWHQLDWDADLKTVKKVLGKEWVDTVSELDTGNAIIQTDFLEETKQKIHVLRKKTFDAGATPDLGEFEQPELKSVSGDLVDELQEISEKKKQEKNRIDELNEKIEEKEEEIEDLEDENEKLRQSNETVDKLADRLAQVASGGEEGSEALDEIREEKDSRIRELESQKNSLQDELEDLQARNKELNQKVQELEEYEDAHQHMDELKEAVERMNEALGIDMEEGDDKLKQKLQNERDKNEKLKQKLQEARDYDSSEFIGSDRYDRLASNIANRNGTCSKSGIDRVMEELDRGSKTLPQLSNAVGLAKSTLKDQYLRELKKQGWIEKSGDNYQLSDQVKP